MLETNHSPEYLKLDEAVWQAWRKKNAAQDKFRSARRVKVVGISALFITAGALLWNVLL